MVKGDLRRLPSYAKVTSAVDKLTKSNGLAEYNNNIFY